MKKLLLLVSMVVFAFLLVSCKTLTVNEVESLSIAGWDVQERYRLNQSVSLSDASVTVHYVASAGKDDLTLPFSTASLVFSGSGTISGGILKTDTLGKFDISVTYDDASVTVSYEIVKNLILPGDTINSAYFNGLNVGETVYVAAGTHFVSTSITLPKAVNIVGSTLGQSIINYTNQGSGIPNLFIINRAPTLISNLTLQVGGSDLTHGGLISIVPNTITDSGEIRIENNIIRGTWLSNILFFNLFAQGIGISTTDKNCANVDIVINNNEIYNLRSGIVITRGTTGNVHTLTITNNNIFHTKGGMLLYQLNANDNEITNITVTNNTWDSIDPSKYLSHSEWDIVWFNWSDTLFTKILSSSVANNGAYVLDRNQSFAYDSIDGTEPKILGTATLQTYNRSHVFIVLPNDLANFRLNVNANAYKSNLSAWSVSVATYSHAGSLSYTSVVGETGIYNLLSRNNPGDHPWYLDPISGAAGDRGGNRDFYWKPATSLAMALECIVAGGTIMLYVPGVGYVAHTQAEVTAHELTGTGAN